MRITNGNHARFENQELRIQCAHHKHKHHFIPLLVQFVRYSISFVHIHFRKNNSVEIPLI